MRVLRHVSFLVLAAGSAGCRGPTASPPAAAAVSPAATAAVAPAAPAPAPSSAAPPSPVPSASAAPARPHLDLLDWKPVAMGSFTTTKIERPRLPSIDVHTHFAIDTDRATLLAQMDRYGVEQAVNLSGGTGEKLRALVDAFDRASPGRFLTFANMTYDDMSPGWGKRARDQLARDVELGAKGLKIFKALGLRVTDAGGKRVRLDDPELDPIFSLCEEKGLPILWHVADPAAFFVPFDEKNERWLELQEEPSWSFSDTSRFPTREQLFAERDAMLKRHPRAKVIAAHMASLSEDLDALAAFLDRNPSVVVDIAASINELGRRPYATRRFFIKYQDRILFGTDLPPGTARAVPVYARFLETEDEYFDTERANGRQGMWNVYGLYLPYGVLVKVYRDNARRVLHLGRQETSRRRPHARR